MKRLTVDDIPHLSNDALRALNRRAWRDREAANADCARYTDARYDEAAARYDRAEALRAATYAEIQRRARAPVRSYAPLGPLRRPWKRYAFWAVVVLLIVMLTRR